MKAISLHQPWASLCVTRQPCDEPDGCGETGFVPSCGCPETAMCIHGFDRCSCRSMVKRFETRSWPCPPKLIGSRILIHATKRHVQHAHTIGDWRTYCADAVSAPNPKPDRMYHRSEGWATRPEAPIVLPLGAIVGSATIEACYPIVGYTTTPRPRPYVMVARDGSQGWVDTTDGRSTGISDQMPYGDYSTDGKPRYAWLLTDAAPTTERCPWCGLSAATVPSMGGRDRLVGCPVCDGAGRCDPIPAKGRQRIWNWEPE